MSISNTGFIKGILGHYGEVTLLEIKTKAEIINAYNYRREHEDEKIYTC